MDFSKAKSKNGYSVAALFLSSQILLTMAPSSHSAFAMGSAPPATPTTPAGPTLPNPERDVVVRQFQNVQAFQTPNQVTTSLDSAQTELSGYLNSAVASSKSLRVIQGTPADLADTCGKHLEIWPQVLAFELDGLDASFSFGFNSTGTINVGQPSATGTDTVRLGNVEFGLFVYLCDNSSSGSCTSLLSTTANQTVLSNDFSFKVTWSSLSAGGDIFNKTDLGTAVEQILTQGVNQLIASSQMVSVPWTTSVAAVNTTSAGTSITMAAGETSGILLNQYFTVYSPIPGTSNGSCGVLQALACVSTSEVDGPSSIASVYKTLQAGVSQSIQVGDTVQVGASSCAP